VTFQPTYRLPTHQIEVLNIFNADVTTSANKFVTFTIQKGVTKRKAYCFYSPATKTMRKKITNGWLID